MPESSSQRRLTENEVIFRQLNEQIHKGMDETNRLAREDGQPEFMIDLKKGDQPLSFFCECADETCASRISISIKDYRNIHRHKSRFIVIPGHEVASIEKVIREHPGYMVVQKYLEPPEKATTLHPTSLNNS